MIISLIIAIIAVVGVSTASGHAQPGDMLYPVKVHVTEEAQEAVHFSKGGKINFMVNRLDTRFSEAAKLSTKTKVDAKATQELDQAYSDDVKDIANYISELQAKGDFKAASDLSIRARGKLGSGTDTVKGDTNTNLLAKIHADEDTFGKVSILLQTKVESDAKAEAESTTTTTGREKESNGSVEVNSNVKGGLKVKGGSESGIQEKTEGGVKVKVGI